MNNQTAFFQTSRQAHTFITLLESRRELRHGEYSIPTYRARLNKQKNLWYIHQTPYYFEGTLNAPKSGPIPYEDWHFNAISAAE